MTVPSPPREAWYIAARTSDIENRPIARTILGDLLVLFRDEDGRPVALSDRCLHRNMALSAGRAIGGCIECPYHGWRYDARGRCVAIPSLGENTPVPSFAPLRVYPAVESDGYVWVWMGAAKPSAAEPCGVPRRFPYLGDTGWTSFRMITRFRGSAFACLENFLDCPHTVFVHRVWFRKQSARELTAHIRRFDDRVVVEFHDEPRPKSIVSTLFFPADEPLRHTDQFLLPATSRVDYVFDAGRRFVITSQCTPVSEHETLVYTVITFRYRRLGALVRLLLESVCRWIIRQDVTILARQTAQLQRFGGPQFTTVPTDLFARHIRALWARAGDVSDAPRDVVAIAEIDEEIPIRF